MDTAPLETCYADARVWERFEPGLMALCSPDPQAFRPDAQAANVLQVGLPTNFKACSFADPAHADLLRELEAGIDAVRLDGKEVPVKLRVSDSLFVPLAKWSMLMTGNYRCVLPGGARSIRDAVHEDLELSREIYEHVDEIAHRLGADRHAQVPFEKYARAAESLLKPSSVARAAMAGAPLIERVDQLIQLVGRQFGLIHPVIDETVATVDAALSGNRAEIA